MYLHLHVDFQLYQTKSTCYFVILSYEGCTLATASCFISLYLPHM